MAAGAKGVCWNNNKGGGTRAGRRRHNPGTSGGVMRAGAAWQSDEGRLFLRRQRLFQPAVKLLLVGFDPAVNVALDIRF